MSAHPCALPSVPALRKWIGPRESLDAIDEAYLKHEFPMMIYSGPAQSLGKVLESMSGPKQSYVLPTGTRIEIIGPMCSQHPSELARWRDDGGTV